MKKDPRPLRDLKERGHRRTPIRTALIELFLEGDRPLSAPEILDVLGKKGVHVNKTTVYRDLSFLKDQGIVEDVRFNERQVRYELADEYAERHHHHLVCTSCDSVEDVELPGHLIQEELEIESRTRFLIQRHTLEFFGLCSDCTRGQNVLELMARDKRITKQLMYTEAIN